MKFKSIFWKLSAVFGVAISVTTSLVAAAKPALNTPKSPQTASKIKHKSKTNNNEYGNGFFVKDILANNTMQPTSNVVSYNNKLYLGYATNGLWSSTDNFSFYKNYNFLRTSTITRLSVISNSLVLTTLNSGTWISNTNATSFSKIKNIPSNLNEVCFDDNSVYFGTNLNQGFSTQTANGLYYGTNLNSIAQVKGIDSTAEITTIKKINNEVLVGTKHHGLFVGQKNSFSHLKGVTDTTIRNITQVQNSNNVIVGTTLHAYVIDTTSLTTIQNPTILNNNITYTYASFNYKGSLFIVANYNKPTNKNASTVELLKYVSATKHKPSNSIIDTKLTLPANTYINKTLIVDNVLYLVESSSLQTIIVSNNTYSLKTIPCTINSTIFDATNITLSDKKNNIIYITTSSGLWVNPILYYSSLPIWTATFIPNQESITNIAIAIDSTNIDAIDKTNLSKFISGIKLDSTSNSFQLNLNSTYTALYLGSYNLSPTTNNNGPYFLKIDYTLSPIVDNKINKDPTIQPFDPNLIILPDSKTIGDSQSKISDAPIALGTEDINGKTYAAESIKIHKGTYPSVATVNFGLLSLDSKFTFHALNNDYKLTAPYDGAANPDIHIINFQKPNIITMVILNFPNSKTKWFILAITSTRTGAVSNIALGLSYDAPDKFNNKTSKASTAYWNALQNYNFFGFKYKDNNLSQELVFIQLYIYNFLFSVTARTNAILNTESKLYWEELLQSKKNTLTHNGSFYWSADNFLSSSGKINSQTVIYLFINIFIDMTNNIYNWKNDINVNSDISSISSRIWNITFNVKDYTDASTNRPMLYLISNQLNIVSNSFYYQEMFTKYISYTAVSSDILGFKLNLLNYSQLVNSTFLTKKIVTLATDIFASNPITFTQKDNTESITNMVLGTPNKFGKRIGGIVNKESTKILNYAKTISDKANTLFKNQNIEKLSAQDLFSKNLNTAKIVAFKTAGGDIADYSKILSFKNSIAPTSQQKLNNYKNNLTFEEWLTRSIKEYIKANTPSKVNVAKIVVPIVCVIFGILGVTILWILLNDWLKSRTELRDITDQYLKVHHNNIR